MIYVNGKEEPLNGNISVAELVARKQMRPERIAVEMNGKIIPKAEYENTKVEDGDTIEIVSFVGGG